MVRKQTGSRADRRPAADSTITSGNKTKPTKKVVSTANPNGVKPTKKVVSTANAIGRRDRRADGDKEDPKNVVGLIHRVLSSTEATMRLIAIMLFVALLLPDARRLLEKATTTAFGHAQGLAVLVWDKPLQSAALGGVLSACLGGTVYARRRWKRAKTAAAEGEPQPP